MFEEVKKPRENKSRAVANSVSQQKNTVKQVFGFVDNRPEAMAQTKLQGRANNSLQTKSFEAMANEHVTQKQPVQRKINLHMYSGKENDVDLSRVLTFLGASDRHYDTNNRPVVEGDFGFRTALERLIAHDEFKTYGFLQASELMTDIRREAALTHRGGSYELDRTFRGADQARDSVFKVTRGGETSVIKQGPDLANEAEITARVSGHVNVVGMLDKEDDNSQIRLEYASQGNLEDFNVDSANKARVLIQGIIKGLNHIHQQGAVHGDVGAANVFVGGTQEAPVAKMADFGESMQGVDAITNNLANDISAGSNLLQTLAKNVDSEDSRAFVITLIQLQTNALQLIEKAQSAAPHTEETIALYQVLGEEPPPQGPPPTANEITDIRARWVGLLESAFLAE